MTRAGVLVADRRNARSRRDASGAALRAGGGVTMPLLLSVTLIFLASPIKLALLVPLFSFFAVASTSVSLSVKALLFAAFVMLILGLMRRSESEQKFAGAWH